MKLVRDTISEIINGEFKLVFKMVLALKRHLAVIFSYFISVTCDGLEANHAFHMGLTTTLNSEVHARLKVCGEIDPYCLSPIKFASPLTLKKKIIPKRHRMVVQTFLIEHNDQDIQIGSKWLWNPDHDDHVTVTKSFSTFSVAVNAHFIYIE